MLDEQLTAAEELRRLRLLIDRLPAIIGYWDRDLRNVIANGTYVTYFRLAPDEIRGRHMREVIGDELFTSLRPHVDGVLAGRTQVFEATLPDTNGVARSFAASYIPDIVDGDVCGFYCHAIDVTARVEAERVRDEALRLFQISMANAPIGETLLTTDGRALRINPALCQLIGASAEELAGASYRDFVHPDDLPGVIAEHRKLVSGEVSHISSEQRYIRRDGTVIWMQRNAVLAPGGEYGAEDVIIAQMQDVTARKLAEAELARMAVTDQLTGLHNRHALVNHIEEYRAARPTASVGIVFIDLDGFKHVNDSHGHAAGDAVLTEVARRLSEAVAAPSSVYRLGGDEFIVLVPDADEGAAVAGLAEQYCAALTGDYDVGSGAVALSASVGCTSGPTGDVEDLIRKADADMYRHKSRPRSAVNH